ncbi:MAG: hypothetical protein M3Q65_12195 [Chloroflexota bacterium]|nr:hypothetical protein [Chloroflexota bacterium]
MKVAIDEQVDAIRSRDDFVSFVHALVQDLKENPDEWESCELGDYLEGLAVWVGTMDQLHRNLGEPVPKEPTWNLFGQMLLGAKYQE